MQVFESTLRTMLSKFVRLIGFQWCPIFMLNLFTLLSRTALVLSFMGTKTDNSTRSYSSPEGVYIVTGIETCPQESSGQWVEKDLSQGREVYLETLKSH